MQECPTTEIGENTCSYLTGCPNMVIFLDVNCLQQFLTQCSVGCLGVFLTPQLYIFNCPNTHHPSGKIFVGIWCRIFPGHLSCRAAQGLSPSAPCITCEQKIPSHSDKKQREASKYLQRNIWEYILVNICYFASHQECLEIPKLINFQKQSEQPLIPPSLHRFKILLCQFFVTMQFFLEINLFWSTRPLPLWSTNEKTSPYFNIFEQNQRNTLRYFHSPPLEILVCYQPHRPVSFAVPHLQIHDPNSAF